MAQGKKGSYCRYQKASINVDAYTDGKNPHGCNMVEDMLFKLGKGFSDRKRVEYLKNKKKPKSYQLSVAADIMT